MDWLEIGTKCDNESVEAVSEVLRRYVYVGVSIDQEIEPYPEGEGYLVRADTPVIVRGYLPLDGDVDSKLRSIEEALWHLGQLRPIEQLKALVVSEHDWSDAWKEFFHVHHIGKRIVVKPSWRDYDPRPDDLIVTIDPGMAFGTGLHPTTNMTVVEMENHVRPGQSVLDLGTGSGILAIVAARLGAREVLALDTDSVAVETARANVALNGLQAIVRVDLGSLQNSSGATPASLEERFGNGRDCFDVVVANIIASVIVENSRSLAAVTRPSGIVIASGIIDEKCAWVVDGLTAAGLRIVSQFRSGDWVALVGQKVAA
ncbi:MAG: 50S ribosomal protein L11 methyltransferase [Chloroflexi bacterium]|nr:50S ribosomal protein L11 methyltransferase [Chloroflexota bacterium]